MTCTENIYVPIEIFLGFTEPLAENEWIINVLPDDIIKADDQLKVRRKPMMIVRSKALKQPGVFTGDII